MLAELCCENAAPWVGGFVIDGVLGGLFAVLGFLPQILMLFLFFSILEDTGYARNRGKNGQFCAARKKRNHADRARTLLFFIKKAFTIILASTIVIWFLSSFSWDWRFLVETRVVDGEEVTANFRMNESILGSLGMDHGREDKRRPPPAADKIDHRRHEVRSRKPK